MGEVSPQKRSKYDRGVKLLLRQLKKKPKRPPFPRAARKFFFNPFLDKSILGNFYEKLTPLLFNGQHRGHAFKYT